MDGWLGFNGILSTQVAVMRHTHCWEKAIHFNLRTLDSRTGHWVSWSP